MTQCKQLPTSVPAQITNWLLTHTHTGWSNCVTHHHIYAHTHTHTHTHTHVGATLLHITYTHKLVLIDKLSCVHGPWPDLAEKEIVYPFVA
jgi:hypothetical protein